MNLRFFPPVALLVLMVFSSGIKAEETHEAHSPLPVHLRLAFMSGHVEAGLELYRRDELTMAAPHLLHPVSETHSAERVGLKKLGFDDALFVVISAALDAGKSATAITPLLQQAQDNLAQVTERAGGDSIEIIEFLLHTLIEEYSIGVTDSVVTDIGEYQDAYGFHVVARHHTKSLPEETQVWLVQSLDALGDLWLDGPVPVSEPTSVEVMTDAVEVILGKLTASQ